MTSVISSDTIKLVRTKHLPADFEVQEQLGLDLGTRGEYAVYRVEKRNITTFQAQARLADALGCARSAVQFAGLKDQRAVALQHASIKGNPPAQINGDAFMATHAGRLDRPLRSSDIKSNHFAITLRDLAPGEAERIACRLEEVAKHGLPNYFDQQRFGSYSPEAGFIGAHVLERDAEGALRAYLAVPYVGDPANVKRFKKATAGNWGDWDTLFAAAPKPSNYRSVLTFLRDHPDDYRKALNLIPRQLLSLWLSAFQSSLWNRIVGQYLETLLAAETPRVPEPDWLEIATVRLPLHRTLPAGLRDQLGKLSVIMPHHRAVYPEPALARAAGAVLEAEGLTTNDLKARILKKAYLSRDQRPLLLFPTGVVVQAPADDECFPGRLKMVVRFTVPRGSYATLVIKSASIGKSC